MATRCIISVKGSKIGLYVHYDGYPKHIIPWLYDFSKSFIEKRGVDDDYFMAQLVRDSVFSAEKHKLDESRVTGYGLIVLSGAPNMGEEFVYSVDCTKETIDILTVYKKQKHIIDLKQPMPIVAELERIA